MANIERQTDGEGPNIIEKTARFLLGQISMEDMTEGKRKMLSDFLEFMDHNSKIKEIVYAKKDEIMATPATPQNGRKIPLYTKEELAKAKRHRGRKRTSPERVFQPVLFQVEEPVDGSGGNPIPLDPERKLNRLHAREQSPFSWNKNKAISKEIKQKRQELRDRIGLPVARGKSEHVNDKFYKFLVRRIVNFDTFGIFCEFDRVMTQSPPELDAKIGEVSGLVTELLSGGFNRKERFQRFYEFSREYTEKWGE